MRIRHCFGILALLALGCAAGKSVAPRSVLAVVKPQLNDDPSCTAPPDYMFGAERAGCTADSDTGNFCCGYGAAVFGGEYYLVCAYRLCRAECSGEFKADIAMCLPASELKKADEESQIDEERNIGQQRL